MSTLTCFFLQLVFFSIHPIFILVFNNSHSFKSLDFTRILLFNANFFHDPNEIFLVTQCSSSMFVNLRLLFSIILFITSWNWFCVCWFRFFGVCFLYTFSDQQEILSQVYFIEHNVNELLWNKQSYFAIKKLQKIDTIFLFYSKSLHVFWSFV